MDTEEVVKRTMPILSSVQKTRQPILILKDGKPHCILKPISESEGQTLIPDQKISPASKIALAELPKP